jgi:tetratricopeptide (TPR) repeat protein
MLGGRRGWVAFAALLIVLAAVGLVSAHFLRADPLAPGLAAYARREWTAAHSVAFDRLKQNGNDAAAIRLLARSAARLGRDESAQALYGKLRNLSGAPNAAPLTSEDYYLLGLVLDRLGMGQGARQVWGEARPADVSDPELLQDVARSWAQADRLTPAAEAAARLATLPGWEVRGDLMLGMIRDEQGDRDAAAACLARALKRDPQAKGAPSAPALYAKALARNLLRAGRPEEARAPVQELLNHGPDPEAAWLLSRAYLQLDDQAQAGKMLTQAGSYRDEFPMVPEPAPYVGAAACAKCHSAIYQTQQNSLHAQTFARAEDLTKLPIPAQPMRDPGNAMVTHRFTRAGSTLEVETHAADSTFRALVDYAFGSGDRGLTLVGHDQSGQSYELRLSHYADGSVWDPTSGHNPRPDLATQARLYLGESLTADETRRCFLCHTTDARAAEEKIAPVAADHSIGCERCHGPGGNHVKAVASKFPDLAIVNPGHGSGEQIVALCAQCHSPRGRPVAHDDPTSVRSQGTTLTWSRCYTESQGALSCVTCHNPHRNAVTSAEHYESKCLSCHSGATEKAGQRPRGVVCPVNSSKGCVGCHMPVVKGVIPHSPFTDHNIRVHRAVGSAP